MAVIGVDLGGTKISSALLSGADQITCHNKVYLNKAKGEEVGELIKTRIQFLLAEAEKTGETVTSVGVSVPGIYYATTGKVWAPNIPGWDNYPLLILIGLVGIVFTSVVPLIPYLFFLIGLGGGMINGVTNVIVAALFPENSSAYLSLLGVFYGVGALGFPLTTSVLLDGGLTYQEILSIVSLFLFIPLALVSLVKFPKCPHTKPIPMKQYFGFFTKPAILLVGLFLFFQSAVEAIVPVWTPTYLKETFLVSYDKGLFAITVCALGITLTRLALSQILKKTSPYRVVFISMLTIIVGALLLEFGNSFYLGLAGIAMMGIGLAASFPVMLSYTAGFFPANAGTAFSMVIGIALVGNISLNAFTGCILDTFGIGKLNVLIISFILIMIFLLKIINYKLLKNNDHVSKKMAE